MEYDKPLSHYSATGNEETVRALLQRGVNVDEKNEHEETPLVCADFNKPNIVKLLLDAGADVNAANEDRQRPLHLAVLKNSLESVKLLIQAKADVHARDNRNKIPLKYAVENNFLDIVKVLLEVTRPFGISNLCLAVNLSNEEIVKLILECNVNVNDENANGNYPLLFTSHQPNLNITHLLLDHGANVNKRHKVDGITALHRATRKGCIEQMKLLIQRGANVHIKTSKGETPLHLATRHFRKNTYNIIKFLIQHGADCNGFSNSEITPMNYALITCNRQVNEFLLEHGGNLVLRESFGATALHYAVLNSHVDVIDMVLDNGLDINAPDKKGYTALHIAIKMGLAKPCELLLNRGADINKKSVNNKTPLYYIFNMRSHSSRLKDEKIKNILVKHIAKLKFQNIPVNIQNEEIIKNNPELQEYYLLCTEELCKMEKHYIFKDFSLFQLFFKNKNNMVGYAKNEELVSAYESSTVDLLKHYPIYFTSDIIKNFENQITKQRQMKKTINKLCNIFHTNLDVSENTVKYLEVDDLDYLNKL